MGPTVSAWLSALKVLGTSTKEVWFPTMPSRIVEHVPCGNVEGSPQVGFVLTTRERECLQWTIRGKTTWEVATILGISQHTVAAILRSAISRMEAPNKQSAALKAFQLGLLGEEVGNSVDSDIVKAGPSEHGISKDLDVRTWPDVRMQIGALRDLCFEHLITDSLRVLPPRHAGRWALGGRTLWHSTVLRQRVGLQWPWVMDLSGLVMLEDPLAIETNVQVVNVEDELIGSGPPILERMHVLNSLRWQQVVADAFGVILPELRDT